MKRNRPEEEARKFLAQAENGVLSLITPEGQPYGVMVNHVYDETDNCIFFHCANKGKKLDCIRANPQASFFAVSRNEILPARYATHYDSVIVTGRASVVSEEDEKRRRLELLCDRFSPGEARREEVIQKFWNAVTICKVTIDSITGKSNRDE